MKPIPDKEKHATEDTMERLQGPDTSSLSAFLCSFFSCSESGVRCADDPATDLDDVGKKPVVSISRPVDVKSRRRARRSAAKNCQVQEGSIIAFSTDVEKSEPEDDEKDWQIITTDDLQEADSEKQEMGLPGISDTSAILSESLRSSLCAELPTLVRGREWELLYSTWKHGISLLTLYRRSTYLSGPCLLVVEDSRGTVFGGLLLSPLNPTVKTKFQGTNDTFVFTNISTKLSLFHPTGLNRYFFLCTNEMLAFGGGGSFALHLDGDLLHGSSGHSETFGNCCLAHTEEFTVRHVELWGFAHTSKYVPEKALYQTPVEAPGICRW